jgi:hypothetical protein
LIHVYLGTIHTALGGFTPAQIMFGRKFNLNLEPPKVDNVPKQARVVDFVVKLQLALDRAHKIVLEIIKSKEFENIKPSLGKKTLSYNVGDKVGLLVESLPAGVKSKKLFPRYSGPFTVETALHDGKVLYLKDVHGKIRKVPVSINNVKPWPDRQTLLERFEKYEVLKRKVPSPDMAGTLVSSPDTPVDVEKEPAEELKDMVVDDIIPTPVSEPVVVATPTVAKPIERLNDPIDLDYERYFDDDYDIMGNPINYDVSHFRSVVVNKFDALTKDMYIIQDIPVYRHRLCELPTKGRKKFYHPRCLFLTW